MRAKASAVVCLGRPRFSCAASSVVRCAVSKKPCFAVLPISLSQLSEYKRSVDVCAHFLRVRATVPTINCFIYLSVQWLGCDSDI